MSDELDTGMNQSDQTERLGLRDTYERAKQEPEEREDTENHSLVAGFVVGISLTVIVTAIFGSPSLTAAGVAVLVFFVTSLLWAQPWKWEPVQGGDSA